MFKIVLLALVASLGLRFERGFVGYYADGIMRDVVAMRQSGNTAMPLPRELPKVCGYIATADCDDVGKLACLWHKSEGWRCPYLVADCANRLEGHDERMRRLGIVCDIDYATAARWRVLGHGGTGEAGIRVGMIVWDK